MKGVSVKELEKIQGMNYDEKRKVIFRLPVKVGTYLYSQYCDPNQLKVLFEDWDRIVSDAVRAVEFDKDFEKVQKKHIEKIKALIKVLKKQKRSYLVPVFVLEKYK